MAITFYLQSILFDLANYVPFEIYLFSNSFHKIQNLTTMYAKYNEIIVDYFIMYCYSEKQ